MVLIEAELAAARLRSEADALAEVCATHAQSSIGDDEAADGDAG